MRDRTVTGFGPTSFQLTNSSTGTGAATGSWIPVGPFNVEKFSAMIVFSPATSGLVAALQGTVTTASTQPVTLVTQTGDQSGAFKHSTYTSGVVSHVRIYSSAIGAATSVSGTITAYINALP